MLLLVPTNQQLTRKETLAGGNVVLLYASKYHDVHNVVNVSGRYDLNRGIEERLGNDFLEKIKKDGFIDVRNTEGLSTPSVISFFL